MQLAYAGYPRRENVGGSLVSTVVLIYSPDSTQVDGSTRDGDFEGIGSV